MITMEASAVVNQMVKTIAASYELYGIHFWMIAEYPSLLDYVACGTQIALFNHQGKMVDCTTTFDEYIIACGKFIGEQKCLVKRSIELRESNHISPWIKYQMMQVATNEFGMVQCEKINDLWYHLFCATITNAQYAQWYALCYTCSLQYRDDKMSILNAVRDKLRAIKAPDYV